ncbi:hypothetical protein KSF_074180 [Reticulibacter mediterranei]|uniref:Uncharacterized protein n=1 Tax=Reticulibacter mediterranei TaxID=2778369 RepID=A0A8J3IRV3_9CHLR|nr:hypothetical protein [Reticulibacter mediterranei]GHO97370.1 hypothetical protein KSF_074180 [Reticulibacter mediterranei]
MPLSDIMLEDDINTVMSKTPAHFLDRCTIQVRRFEASLFGRQGTAREQLIQVLGELPSVTVNID